MFLITGKDSQYLLHTSISQVPAQVVSTKLTTQPIENVERMHQDEFPWSRRVI